jgi:hypothetical protein
MLWSIPLVFNFSSARAEESINFFPIKIVQRPALDNDAYDKVLEQRVAGRFKKQDSGCEAEATRVKLLFDKLIKKSQLESFATGDTGIFTVVPCDSETFLSTGAHADGRILMSRWVTKNIKNESQLAFAIAHEIGHFTLAHDELHIRGSEYKIDDEKAADNQALRIMANAGFDIREAIKFQEEVLKIAVGPNSKICYSECDPDSLDNFKKTMTQRLVDLRKAVSEFGQGDQDRIPGPATAKNVGK